MAETAKPRTSLIREVCVCGILWRIPLPQNNKKLLRSIDGRRWRAFFQNVWLKNESFDRNLKIAPSIIIALKRSFTLAACGK